MIYQSRIQLLFRRSYGLFAGLIAWWGSSVRGYSHVDARMADGSLIGARDDAIRPPRWRYRFPAGIQRRPANYEPFKYADLVTVPVSRETEERWTKFQEAGIGDQYDKDAILGFLFGRRWHANGHWICSARQLAGLQHVGLLQKLPVPPQRVTPDALFLLAASIRGATVTPIKGQPK